jgi:hypothetical protein
VPVFIKPSKEKSSRELSSASLDKGTVVFSVKNTGNVHFTIPAIKLSSDQNKLASTTKLPQVLANEPFKKEIASGLLLAGAARAYSIKIPLEVCNQIEKIDIIIPSNNTQNINIDIDKSELKSSLIIDHAQCQ